MTSFKSFRNRAGQPRANGDSQPVDGQATSASGHGRHRDDASSTATELGPQHYDILRQIESGDLKLILYDSRVKSRAIGVVRHCYGAPRPVMIRSLDALQIASALEGGATEMVSADLRMRGCGILFGLRVLPE